MKSIKVVVVEPSKPAEVRMIENDEESTRALVGGDLQDYVPLVPRQIVRALGSRVFVFCNEEGLRLQLPPNTRLPGILGTVVVSQTDAGGTPIDLVNAEEIARQINDGLFFFS